MMTEVLKEAMDTLIKERLQDRKQRELVVSSVMAGFAQLRKKPVADLPQRMERMEKRIREMAEDVSLSFVNGRLVFKVVGSSEALMTELRRGSNWYEPWEKIDETVLAAILVDPSQ